LISSATGTTQTWATSGVLAQKLLDLAGIDVLAAALEMSSARPTKKTKAFLSRRMTSPVSHQPVDQPVRVSALGVVRLLRAGGTPATGRSQKVNTCLARRTCPEGSWSTAWL